ncbi:MAG: carbohydrate ABC transporter permease, partial [Thermomicrobiales bacterium]
TTRVSGETMAVQELTTTSRARAATWHAATLPGRAGLYVLLVLGVVVMATPFVWTLLASFKENTDIFRAPVQFLPRVWTQENYRDLLSGEQIPFLRQFANSAIIAVGQTILTVILASLAGFAFAKYEFFGKRLLFLLTLLTLMIPFEVTVVPLFQLMIDIGWLDTYWAVIVPGAINAFGVFFMRQVMLAVPNDLLDAARADGATEFGIYWRIVLPLARGGLAVLAVLSFLGAWNDYLWPLIALRSPDMFTLPIGLATLSGLYRIEWGMIMAGAILTTLPILALFLWTRNHIISGLTAGAIKA